MARAALHFWEEPPISGEDGSGTIFFSGCPLRCVYCQNASIALGEAARAITVERLAAIMGELEAAGALNINCVTPMRRWRLATPMLPTTPRWPSRRFRPW